MITGGVPTRPHWDNLGAKLNSMRTLTHLKDADIVVVKFGEKYKQWNAAFEAGLATAKNIPVVTIHPPELSHMLKEVNAYAAFNCKTVGEVAAALEYTMTGKAPQAKEGFVASEEIWGKGNKNPGGK